MWLVSYADLMTLLFAAFVVLYGLKSEGETREFRGVVSSIREAFIEIPDQIRDPEQGPSHAGKFVFKNLRQDQKKSRVIKKFKRSDHFVNSIVQDFEVLNKAIDQATDEKIGRKFNKRSKNVSVQKEGNTLTINIAASALFEPGSYRLKRKQLIKLEPIAVFLSRLDRDIIIQAYAAKRGKNQVINAIELASLRATFLGRFLTSKHDVPINRVRLNGFSVGHGKMKESNDTSKIENRIDIKIIYD